MDTSVYLNYWAETYKENMLNNIMPFWLKNGLDQEFGGVYTCLSRSGKLLDTTKSVWFQGRFAYACSFAYNQLEKRKEWLNAAKSTLDFIEEHCFDTDGRMFFEVAADGTPIRKRRYVFSESYAIIAMVEYSLATGDKSYVEKALKIFKDMQHALETPGVLESKYMPSVKSQGHAMTMVLIDVASNLKKVSDDPKLDVVIENSLHALKNYFVHPEFKALLETVGPNGEFIDSMDGRLINPGHCIETSWILMELAMTRGGDKKLLDLALNIFNWSWDWGWDDQYGGIINLRDCKNYPVQDCSQDMKFWWPQAEAIIASLYAYKVTNDEKYLRMHKQISDWTYAHFPDTKFGEWYGYLHRDGSVAQSAKGNLFKGPFHIPRMMTKGYQLCYEIMEK